MSNASETISLFCWPVLAMGLVAGCSTTKSVHHAADPDLKPNSYASYHLVDQEVGLVEVGEAIRPAIHRVMKARGLKSTGSQSADLYVSYKVLTVDKGTRPPSAREAAANIGNMGNLGGFAMAGAKRQDKVDKLVLIQLQDAKTLRIVWVGWSHDKVDATNLAARASDAASRILSRVPQRI